MPFLDFLSFLLTVVRCNKLFGEVIYYIAASVTINTNVGRWGWEPTIRVHQGSLTKEEGSVRLTSLYLLVQVSCCYTENICFLFYKTSYLFKEVNCSVSFPSVRVLWSEPSHMWDCARNFMKRGTLQGRGLEGNPWYSFSQSERQTGRGTWTDQTDRWTDWQKDNKTDRRTNIQTDRWKDWQMNRVTDEQSDRWIDWKFL
jgi:hypothetical protein